ncbi:MAG: cell division protein MraZ, partial [uncultured bacterium]
LDKQGRFVVPEYLRSYAKLGKKVVIVGIHTRLEIWDEDTWNKYREQTETDAVDIAEELGALGI